MPTPQDAIAQWQELVDLRRQGLSVADIGRRTGRDHSSVRRSLRRAARGGLAAELTPGGNPPGFQTGKVTVQLGPTGSVEREWRRVHPAAEGMQEWLDGLCEQAKDHGPKLKAPKVKTTGRLLEIPIGDLHMGMYAWAPETGADYDCEKASVLFTSATRHLMQAAGPADEIVLADLGDFLHADNRHGVTENGGNILDTDGRRWRVIEHARNAWVSVIEEAAARYPKVSVIMAPGNHNREASGWLTQVIAAWFRASPHIRVCTDPRTCRFHRFGQSLLGYSHGDKMKPEVLANVMASSERVSWGETLHHAWRCGHIHHSRRVEFQDRGEANGVSVEYFPVLAGRDAWHAEMGYSSRRLLQGIVHDAEAGEIARHTVHARQILGG